MTIKQLPLKTAPKGRTVVAQGEALGLLRELPKALKGRNSFTVRYFAPSGLRLAVRSNTQGYALGYHRLALQARKAHHASISTTAATAEASGFTLLELILALAILAGSLAALGEVIRSAGHNATMTEGETQAQILAASVMDELASGARPLAAVNQTPLDSSNIPPWILSIAVENTAYQELVAVRVSVSQQLDARLQPARFELVRWMANPNYVPPEPTEETDPSTTSSSSSSSSSGSSATGGGTGAQQ